jgi:hypothetical protein
VGADDSGLTIPPRVEVAFSTNMAVDSRMEVTVHIVSSRAMNMSTVRAMNIVGWAWELMAIGIPTVDIAIHIALHIMRQEVVGHERPEVTGLQGVIPQGSLKLGEIWPN